MTVQAAAKHFEGYSEATIRRWARLHYFGDIYPFPGKIMLSKKRVFEFAERRRISAGENRPDTAARIANYANLVPFRK